MRSLRHALLGLGMTALLFTALPLARALRPAPDIPTRAALPLQVIEIPPPPEPEPEPRNAEPAVRRPPPAPLHALAPPPAAPPPPETLALHLDVLRPQLRSELALGYALHPESAPAAPAVDLSIYELAQVDTPPRFLSGPQPRYPLAAQRARRRGSVQVKCVVTPAGRVEDAVIHARGPGTGREFDAVCLQAVRLWRFEPGRVDGTPVPVYVIAPFTFTP